MQLTKMCFFFFNPFRELWDGKRPSTKDAILFFGFDEVIFSSVIASQLFSVFDVLFK